MASGDTEAAGEGCWGAGALLACCAPTAAPPVKTRSAITARFRLVFMKSPQGIRNAKAKYPTGLGLASKNILAAVSFLKPAFGAGRRSNRKSVRCTALNVWMRRVRPGFLGAVIRLRARCGQDAGATIWPARRLAGAPVLP